MALVTFDECLARAIGKKAITEAQAEKIRKIVGDNSDQAAANEYLERFITEAMEAKRVRQLQVLATKRTSEAIKVHPGGRGKGIEALLARDVRQAAPGVSNVDFRHRAVYDKARAMAVDAYEQLGVRRLGLVSDDELAQRVGRAMFNEAVDDTATGLGKQLSDAMDMLRQRFNVAGGNISKRKDFGLPQTHDLKRIADAGKKEFVDFTLPQVRRVYTEGGPVENPNHIRKWLEAMYDEAADKANEMTSGAKDIRLETESRRIVFNGYGAWKTYSDRFGHGEKNLLNIVDDHMRAMSRDIAMTEILGPRPQQTIGQLVDEAAKAGQLTPWQRNRIDRLFAVVSGKVDQVGTQWLANAGAFVRSWLVSAQLGGAILSSFNDVVTATAARAANGMPVTRALDSAFRGMSRREAAQLAISADRSLLALQSAKWGELSGAAGVSGKAADFVLRASGLTAWTDAGSRAFGVEFLGHLGGQVRRQVQFDKLHDGLRVSLSKYGINAELWDNIVLRTKTIDQRGAHFLDLDNFGSLVKDLEPAKPFAEAAEQIEAVERLHTSQTPKSALNRRLRELSKDAEQIYDKISTIRDTENRLREMLSTESEFAMMTGADARVRAVSTWGWERGTLVGELARTALLYKSFPMSLMFYHLGRGLSQPTTGGKIGYLTAFIAANTIIGGIALQAKEIVKGRDPMAMNTPEYWINALSQGGGLSIFEALLEAEGGWERVARQLAGPGYALLEGSFNLTAMNLAQAVKGKDTNIGREGSKFLEQHTPGSNLWYTRLVLQRLWWNNLQRLLDSDADASFRRQERNAQKWGRGESWWEPGELAPERAPDLGAVVSD